MRGVHVLGLVSAAALLAACAVIHISASPREICIANCDDLAADAAASAVLGGDRRRRGSR